MSITRARLKRSKSLSDLEKINVGQAPLTRTRSMLELHTESLDKTLARKDAKALSKMTRLNLKERLPFGWTYEEHNERVHIRNSNGEIRIRIDPAETKPGAKTRYRHIHIYNEDREPLDIDGKIVKKNDPAGHIPYND